MEIFSELMKNDQIKRNVLIKFGFGTVNRSEVERWVKEKFPETYCAIKKGLKSTKVIQFAPKETEMITAEERSAFLDRAENYLYSQKEKDKRTEREKDYITEEDLKEMMYEELEFRMDEYCELVRAFVEENDDSARKFYTFLKRKNDENPYADNLLSLIYDDFESITVVREKLRWKTY